MDKYLIITFPESQLFMENYSHLIFLINDDHGVEKHGCAAYFVPETLVKKVRKEFELEMKVK